MQAHKLTALTQIKDVLPMPLYMLSDKLWTKQKQIMLQFNIYDKPGLRIMVEEMLFRVEDFGK